VNELSRSLSKHVFRAQKDNDSTNLELLDLPLQQLKLAWRNDFMISAGVAGG
jgi:hypothetical protein